MGASLANRVGGPGSGGQETPIQWNQAVADGSLGTAKFLHSIPSVHVTHSGPQSVADSANVALAFDTERYDTASMHSSAQDTRLSAPVTGVYVVSAAAVWLAGDAGSRHIALRKNASTNLATDTVVQATNGAQTAATVTTTALLQAGDYVEVVANQTGNVSLQVAQEPGSPEFTMTWVAPGP